jgi:hypothetical protein
MSDPILDEIHRYREEYAARFNYDHAAMFCDIKEREEVSKRNGRVFIPAPEKPYAAVEPDAPATTAKSMESADGIAR